MDLGENFMLEEYGRMVSEISTAGDRNHVYTLQPTPAGSVETVLAMIDVNSEPALSPSRDVENTAWPWLQEKNFLSQTGRSGRHGYGRGKPHVPAAIDISNGAGTASEASPTSSCAPANLVAYAAGSAFTPDDRDTRRRCWESISLQLADIFSAANESSSSNPRPTLYEAVEIYLSEFNVLWPVLSHEQLDPDNHHPVLFLTATSIGATFGHALQRQYDILMHQRLRRLLAASLYELEGADNEWIWLAQARLLTQAASMYFGQHQGFSYAQHLAAITIAQLWRMDFMREPIPNNFVRLSSTTPEEGLARYTAFETRRRIAFGIFRADIYSSVLLSTRPIMTSEEVKLTFPRPDRLWFNADHMSTKDRLQAYRTEDARTL